VQRCYGPDEQLLPLHKKVTPSIERLVCFALAVDDFSTLAGSHPRAKSALTLFLYLADTMIFHVVSPVEQPIPSCGLKF
jgi:hypothetical protein